MHGLESKALYGELLCCTLEVTNVGSEPAAQLKIAPSLPSFFSLTPRPACSAAGAEGEGGDTGRLFVQDAGPSGVSVKMRAWEDSAYDSEAELAPCVMTVPLGDDGKGLEAGGVWRERMWAGSTLSVCVCACLCVCARGRIEDETASCTHWQSPAHALAKVLVSLSSIV